MGSALTNTDNNYQVWVLFLNLTKDLKHEKEIMNFLNVLEQESDKAIQKLQGSPALALAQAAREANTTLKNLSIEFINNQKRLSN